MSEEEKTQEISIPVVAFPPFKLRSSLIDKDPVIWQFLLEDYINLFKKLILIAQSKGHLKLSVKSSQQLAVFMKIYLNEVSQEATRIFSLGAINPDIIKNQKLLKLIIFKFIKMYNLINLKIGDESIWNFLKIYLRLAYENLDVNQSLINVNIVRNLIDGTVKSKLNSKSDDISLIKILHDYLKQFISEAKFDKSDLETLTMLIGQKYQKSMKSNSSSSKQRLIKNGNNNKSDFSERFVNSYWIQILENLYNGGESIHSKTVFEIMIVSLISLQTSKIVNLLSKDLNVNNKVQLVKLYPLLAKIVFSKRFNDLNPDFKEKAKFLNKTTKAKYNNSSTVKFDQLKIKNVNELFPQLSERQVKTLLVENNHEVDVLVGKLLENPDLLNNVKEYKEPKQEKRQLQKKDKNKQQQQNTYKIDDKQFNVQFGKKQRDTKMNIEPDDKTLKQSILNSALRMLYESDEDEPDDTYDSQEVTTATGKLRIGGDIDDDEFEEDKKINKKMEEETKKIEEKLFVIYKTDPESLSRTARYSNYRKQLKSELGWTDEQIEGWARMLQKSPKRFKMLEHQYINVDMSLNRNVKSRTKYTNKKTNEVDEDDDNDDKTNKKNEEKTLQLKSHKNFNQYMDKKKAASHKTKNKSSIANHNRKANHDKKMARIGL